MIILLQQITNRIGKNADGYGADIISIDIQRARDQGLPSYIEVRKLCGLKPEVNCFKDLKKIMNPKNVELLEKTYKNIKDIDYVSIMLVVYLKHTKFLEIPLLVPHSVVWLQDNGITSLVAMLITIQIQQAHIHSRNNKLPQSKHTLFQICFAPILIWTKQLKFGNILCELKTINVSKILISFLGHMHQMRSWIHWLAVTLFLQWTYQHGSYKLIIDMGEYRVILEIHVNNEIWINCTAYTKTHPYNKLQFE